MSQIICETGEICNSYSEYIQSRHWKKKKKQFKESKLYKGVCFCCSKSENDCEIHIHHKTYKRIGKEHLNDFAGLCSICHEIVHELVDETESHKTNLWTAVRKLKRRITREKIKKSKYKKKNRNKQKKIVKKTQPKIIEGKRLSNGNIIRKAS